MIRSVTQHDAQAIVDIYNDYIQNTTSSFECEVLCVEAMQTRIHNTQALGLPWLVAEHQGAVIGYSYAQPWKTRHAYRETVEITIYLHRALHTQGWGSQLYQALFSALKACSVHTAIATIALPNPASIALHKKMGMKPVGHFQEMGYKFSRRIDIQYWQKMLQSS